MIRVYIVDDSYYERDSWKNLIMKDPRTTLAGESETVEGALAVLAANSSIGKPDVILLDMQYRTSGEIEPRLKGLGTISQIREIGLNARIMCLSNNIDPHIVGKAISAGANGYLDKLQVRDGLIDAIEQVYNGVFLISPKIAEILIGVVNELNTGNAKIFPNQKRVSLPRRREEIAHLIFRYGLSAQQVADKLGIAKSTVDKHIGLIRKDLGVVSHDQIVRLITAREI